MTRLCCRLCCRLPQKLPTQGHNSANLCHREGAMTITATLVTGTVWVYMHSPYTLMTVVLIR